MLKWLKNRKVVNNTIVMFMFAVVSMACMTFLALGGMKKISNNMSEMYNARLIPIVEISAASDAIGDLRVEVNKALLNYSEDNDKVIRNTIEGFNVHVAQYEKSKLDKQEVEDINIVKDSINEYAKYWEESKSYIKQKKPIPTEIIIKWDKATETIEKHMEDLEEYDVKVSNKLNKQAESTYSYSRNIFIVVFVITIIMLTILSITVITTIKVSIKDIKRILELISQGDLTVDINVDSQNEFGDMKQNLKVTIQNVHEMVKSINQSSQVIDENAQSFITVADQMQLSSQEVANAIQDVAKGAGDQASDLMKITGVVNEFGEKMDKIETSTSDTNVSAQQVNNMAQKSNSDLIQLVKSINEISSAFENVSFKINDLGKSIGGINQITNTINGIADQTNLLALNAAIEAARAGEAGKGFAVVAEEIRKLAEQSKTSSEEINSLVGEISNETTLVVKTTDVVKEDLKQQINVIQISIESFKHIISAIESIIPEIAEVNLAAIKLDEDKNIIVSEVEMASAISEEISASSQEISASSEEMNASSEEVLANAYSLKEMVNDMIRQVKKFKI